jgi:hypothetical protein
MNASTAPASDPVSADSLALYQRRWTAWFSLPFGVVMWVCGLVCIVIVINNIRTPLAVALGLTTLFVTATLGTAVIQHAWRALTDRSPVLVIDSTGILDTRDKGGFIPWELIERVSSNEGDGNDLGIWFKPGAGSRVPGGLRTKLRRAFVGADTTIALGNLVYHPQQLAATLKRLHEQAQHRP